MNNVNFDKLMEDMLKNLRGYRLPKPDARKVSEIERMLTELDWDGIIRTASEDL